MISIDDIERDPEAFHIESDGTIRRLTVPEREERSIQKTQDQREREIRLALGTRKDPVELNEDEKARLVEQFRGILGSGVTRAALQSPSTMALDDIVINLHLYNRLFIALGLVTKMKGYSHDPAWLADLCTREELEAALCLL
jgi:hypothetical protein